ncbi:hypothetical protein Tco_0936646 [Tanacetum coccineum]|uniref:Uncharacterized protein n=1 Tax=Tanacetum coccineum TaxID=301880 RepID=A0ABQ5DET4_9ASTR
MSVSKKKAPAKTERRKGIKLGGSNEGDDLEPEVPDEKKARDSDDDDQQSNDEQNVSDNSRTNDEEYERINKEMYDDVNVELKDAEIADKGKGNEEILDAEKVDAKNENVNQEVAGDQVNDDAQATVIAALATQNTKVPLQSYSISSDYATKFLNFDNITSTNTKMISMMDLIYFEANNLPRSEVFKSYFLGLIEIALSFSS